MKQAIIEAESEQDTAALGKRLAELLPPGSVVALSGDLGAGKTRLVQAVSQALGVDPQDVVSPTFVLIHEYQGRLPIYHFDVYRLRDDDEFLQLGPNEYFESQGVTFVEWANRVQDCLPAQRLEVRIEVTGATARQFAITAVGQRYEAVVNGLKAMG